MILRAPLPFIMVLLLVLHSTSHAQSLRDIFKEVSPAVVVIKTIQKELAPEVKKGFTSVKGLGSGALISKDGKVLTAAHVVQTADAVRVEFQNGQKIPARIVASSPVADVALLQLDKAPPSDITPVRLGDSDLMQTGDQVMVVGTPYGLSHSMTAGYVSGRHEIKNALDAMMPIEVLQSDAAVNRGNSGGPMFNMKGEVVGIVSYILSESGGFEGISFAVSSNMARTLLLEQRTRWYGFEGMIVGGEIAEVLNIPQKAGFLVERVADDSPASRMGLRPGKIPIPIKKKKVLLGGDIILEIGDITISDDPESLRSIRAYVLGLKAGDKMRAKILRAGKIVELSTVLD